MQSPEYGEILASLQEMVRKAYVLGRSEALKQVIDVMQKDETTWKPLALTGPEEDATPIVLADIEPSAPEPGLHHSAAPEADAPVAWWNRPTRKLPVRGARHA